MRVKLLLSLNLLSFPSPSPPPPPNSSRTFLFLFCMFDTNPPPNSNRIDLTNLSRFCIEADVVYQGTDVTVVGYGAQVYNN